MSYFLNFTKSDMRSPVLIPRVKKKMSLGAFFIASEEKQEFIDFGFGAQELDILGYIQPSFRYMILYNIMYFDKCNKNTNNIMWNVTITDTPLYK